MWPDQVPPSPPFCNCVCVGESSGVHIILRTQKLPSRTFYCDEKINLTNEKLSLYSCSEFTTFGPFKTEVNVMQPEWKQKTLFPCHHRCIPQNWPIPCTVIMRRKDITSSRYSAFHFLAVHGWSVHLDCPHSAFSLSPCLIFGDMRRSSSAECNHWQHIDHHLFFLINHLFMIIKPLCPLFPHHWEIVVLLVAARAATFSYIPGIELLVLVWHRWMCKGKTCY